MSAPDPATLKAATRLRGNFDVVVHGKQQVSRIVQESRQRQAERIEDFYADQLATCASVLAGMERVGESLARTRAHLAEMEDARASYDIARDWKEAGL